MFYKGHAIRDTFRRLVKFLEKIRDKLLHGIEFEALKLQENEAELWDTTIQILENFLGQTGLNSTLSLINGNCVYLLLYLL